MVRNRPTLGTRLVWNPKDSLDYEFKDCTHKIIDSDPTVATSNSNIYQG